MIKIEKYKNNNNYKKEGEIVDLCNHKTSDITFIVYKYMISYNSDWFGIT